MFSFDVTTVDFRTTPVENLFLETYLPLASASALKVYLAGWKQAYDTSAPALRRKDLAEFLNMSEAEVQEGLDFWQEEGLLEVLEGEEASYRFRSLLLLWAGISDPATPARNGEPMPFSSPSQGGLSMEGLGKKDPLAASLAASLASPGSQDRTRPSVEEVEEDGAEASLPDPLQPLSPAQSQGISSMFQALEDFLSQGFSYRVRLKENEIREILRVLATYSLDPAYLTYAYQQAVAQKEASSRAVLYVLAIIENWARFEGITDQEGLDAFLEKEKQKKAQQKLSARASKGRKKGEYVHNDQRMSKEEERAWVQKKLEESMHRMQKGGSRS